MSKKRKKGGGEKVTYLSCRPGQHLWARSVPFGLHRLCMQCSAWWSFSFGKGSKRDGEWVPVGRMGKADNPDGVEEWIMEVKEEEVVENEG